MKIIIATFALFFLSLHHISANGGYSIKGNVKDATTKESLYGASLLLVNEEKHLVSNEMGLFSFENLKEGDYLLVCHYLGYQSDTQEISLKNGENFYFNIVLRPVALKIKDVNIGALRSDPLQTLSQLDIGLRPIQSSQDVLRMVPGLVIGQHAGGGKAEQIFLRGFDIDHGTDIALSVDGMAVNMVSHAHGQGYADLHFLIPELIDRVVFQKGPYNARTGDFATAGEVKFETAKVLENNFVKIEGGQFGLLRSVAAVNLIPNQKSRKDNAFIGFETSHNRGFFEAPQNFRRNNFLAKYNRKMAKSQEISLAFSAFESKWTASGQVPERAVKSGQITRFGAIDPTEGGNTGRWNINTQHLWNINDRYLVKNQVYYSKYHFELYSNFTFFLRDSLNGDQIRQYENRDLLGYNGSIAREFNLPSGTALLEAGLQSRLDLTRNSELSRTLGRKTVLENKMLGDINENSISPYFALKMRWKNRLSSELGMRSDFFRFEYQDKLLPNNPQKSANGHVFSPKLNINYKINPYLEVSGQTGFGFHSNDARLVLLEGNAPSLPRGFGQDIGIRCKPAPSLLCVLSFWRLALEQEFVYVGDEGIVEANGRSLRKGIDVGVRWQLAEKWFFDSDYCLTQPRMFDEEGNAQYIPLAPTQTAAGGLTFKSKSISANVRYRFVGDRAANEDYSLQADGYFINDAAFSYSFFNKWTKNMAELSLSAHNIFNKSWKEAQFETESLLRQEMAPVTEIHFTPGTPFAFKAALRMDF